MNDIKRELELATIPEMPERKDYRIGIIGAGFIVQGCHLVAYQKAGFTPYAITSKSGVRAKEAAEAFQIPNVYDTWQALIDDPRVEILDIAVPPHVQPEIVRYACGKMHIKGILCQKPIAMSTADAEEIARLGEEAGIPIAVNSNMRYDQSMRALKKILEKGLIGRPVIASIDMRAIPDWQTFLKDYKKLEIYAMAVHHIDAFRYLFGDPEKITAVCRTDPRTKFEHTDGIVQYTFQYKDGLMATSLDDVWAWPEEPCEKHNYINWRVEGTDGFAEGDIGWHKREPEFCGSTLRLACKAYPNQWIEPKWETMWFPDAFVGTMASLLRAVESGTEPEISVQDNIRTLACVEACYQSIAEEKTVYLSEILK
ncbi:MAG: Gfo/Idh/MocA family oxidoreductase [Lachnospiraceae bacterium]|nr:Gfo/Idh/MocA family oxidoreductase [Lachnospiraceae bacterium]